MGKNLNLMNPSILFEDTNLAVLNKPAGLLTHPRHLKDKSESLVPWLLGKYPELKAVGDQPTLRPGIVHRLDKDTSGLIIVARSQSAYEYLKKLFQTREVHKTYVALVYGNVKDQHGSINIPLGKIGTKQSTRIHGKHELNEKNAITEYSVMDHFSLGALRFTLLEVRPLTGRTHQIRVHLKSIGHPIFGDNVYGGKQGKLDHAMLKRFFLHALKLSFVSLSGEALSFETDIPKELSTFLETLLKIER